MFGGDPFGNPFNHMRRQMQEMDNMMNSMLGGDPFGGMMGPMMGGRNPMLTNGNSHHQNMALSPFGGGIFGGLMQQMNNFQNISNDPNSTVFTQSTMISYGNDGQPHVVQSSTRKAGDVKETRHSVQKGDEHKMTIGHAIGDRAHYIEKKRDKDGRIRQKQKFVNLDQEEAEDFNTEFKARATRNLSNSFGIGVSNGRNRQQAIEANPTSSKNIRRSGESAPIVTVPDDDDDDEDVRRTGSNNYSKSRYNDDDDDDDVEYVYSSHSNGPTIREISDEEADMSNPKRRKGLLGKFLRSNND